jgi:glyoxylase-like metal-dependent hydrolase (beta-lactamase superfamily II)
MGSALVSWYLIEEDGRLTAVDAGLPGFAGSLEGDLSALGYAPADVEAVVLTHSDSDHTGLAPLLQEAGARVLIHRDDEATAREPGPKSGDASPGQLARHLWRPALWRFVGRLARGGGMKPARLTELETFAGDDVLDVPGSPRVAYTPGHTVGHSSLHFESHAVVASGDEICTWNPLTGALGPQVMPKPFNVDTQECFRSLVALEPLAAELVLPGHGEPWRGAPRDAAAAARDAAARGGPW